MNKLELNARTESSTRRRKRYIPVKNKFYASHIFAMAWMIMSIVLSMPWVRDLAELVTMPVSIFIIGGISYLPGYMNAFMVTSLLLDRQPSFKVTDPEHPVSILVACHNEEKNIRETLRYISLQDYRGTLHVFVIDNNSSDNTAEAARQAAEEFGLHVTVLAEPIPGKHHALNKAIAEVETPLVITLDADTILHASAIRYLISRMASSPEDVCAVAGTVLVRNSRGQFLAKIQEWDYFLGIASVKRLQGLFQGTLVAQGAFSVYKTKAVQEVGGWPDAIGEDIVLTWGFLSRNWRVFYEPLAVAFTDVPENLKHFVRQRSRWARGMVEALRITKPWKQPIPYVKYMTGVNLVMPYLDVVYTFFWLPGLVLALFGHYWIVGPATLFVLPLALLQNYILYRYQRGIFRRLDLKIRRNHFGFVAFVLFYQMLMSPISVWGYLQETFRLRRVWK